MGQIRTVIVPLDLVDQARGAKKYLTQNLPVDAFVIPDDELSLGADSTRIDVRGTALIIESSPPQRTFGSWLRERGVPDNLINDCEEATRRNKFLVIVVCEAKHVDAVLQVLKLFASSHDTASKPLALIPGPTSSRRVQTQESARYDLSDFIDSRSVRASELPPAVIGAVQAQVAKPLAPGIRNQSLKLTRRRGELLHSKFSEGAEDASDRVECFFHAEMREQISRKMDTTLTVTLSRELIEQIDSQTSATASAAVSESQDIMVRVVPRVNCSVRGASSFDIKVPQIGLPRIVHFRVSGQEVGPSELWVEIWQGLRKISTIALQPLVIDTKKSLQASGISSMREEDPPLVELRIYEETCSNDRHFRLRFVVESRDLEILLDKATPEILVPRNEYVGKLYKDIENNWKISDGDLDRFEDRLRSFGADLFRKLVPPEIQAALWENRHDIGSIQVISHEPFIPWEIAFLEPSAHNLEEGSFLAELGLIRWVTNSHWAPSALRLRTGGAYYVVPDYPVESWKLYGAEAEVSFLTQQFQASAVEPAAQAVLKMLRNPGSFDLLHFACHGEASQAQAWSAKLLMEGRVELDPSSPEGFRYYEDSIDVREIQYRSALMHRDGKRSIIFLNSCETGRRGYSLTGAGGMAEAFIQSGAGLFVGALWSVDDHSASVFAINFYQSLMAGSHLTAATKSARDATRKNSDATWLSYCVYGHPYARVEFS